MTLRDWFASWLRMPGLTAASNPDTRDRGRRARTGSTSARVADRGRHSIDNKDQVYGGLATLAPLASAKEWRNLDLDSHTLDRMPLDRIIELLVDVSPDISRGLWDFLRMVNSGWTLKVYQVSAGDTGVQSSTAQRAEDETAKQYLEDFLQRLRSMYGDINAVINRIILGGYLRGGFFCELVLGKKGEAIDLVTPDPATLEWKQVEDPLRGKVWQFGQYQQKEFVPLSIYPTIQYSPIDPLPGRPYGRSPIHPALFPSLFLIGILRDLKRVVSQQGYPRLDLEITLEKIIAAFGDDLAEDPDKMKQVIDQAITEVKSVYSQLQPDDAYIHTDVVKVNRPVGAVDASSLGAVDKITGLLERQMVRALKTMPLMMGIAEGTSEANANRQWEVYTASIQTVQHSVESLLETLFNYALQAAGLQGVVEFRFAVLRASEELRDAQTEALKIQNARNKYGAGWIGQDEAAMEVTGHAADQPEPRAPMVGAPAGGGANPLTAQPEPGINRRPPLSLRNTLVAAALLTLGAGEPSTDEVNAAVEWWHRNAPEEAKGLIDAELSDE